MQKRPAKTIWFDIATDDLIINLQEYREVVIDT